MDKVSMQSNLDSFLDCTTPLVASQFLAKSEIRNLNRLWHPKEREEIEYFTLADLWDCFDEWSAYGAGVPIRLDSGETLVQYYVPYLSAIQIFTSSSSVSILREETESTWETRDSFSDSFSDESESEKLSRSDGGSSEEGLFEQDNHSQMNDRLGYLYYQYFESSSPYGRIPLVDKSSASDDLLNPKFVVLVSNLCMMEPYKISSLAETHPGLMSLRSVDLSPASWMSVAWYPIYHIPMGRTIKDLSTCFLTFHTLSSSFQDMELEDNTEKGIRKRNEGEAIPLPPFGLASYKMQGNVWISDRSGRDQERMVSLLSVADSWLKQLGVQHNDFNYFLGIRRG